MNPQSNLYYTAPAAPAAPAQQAPSQPGFLNRHSGKILGTGALGLGVSNYIKNTNQDNRIRRNENDNEFNTGEIKYVNDKVDTNIAGIGENRDSINQLYRNDNVLDNNIHGVYDRTLFGAADNAGNAIKSGLADAGQHLNKVTAPGTSTGDTIHQIAQGLGLSESTHYKLRMLSEGFGDFLGQAAGAGGVGHLTSRFLNRDKPKQQQPTK